MINYKLEIDLLDVIDQIIHLDLINFRSPFITYFIEASDPDDACYSFFFSLRSAILFKEDSLENKILCYKIKSLIRIDRIKAL